MINLFLLAVLLGVTWVVAAEGPQGAAITFISVILAGLVAMNFFEPLALFFQSNLMGSIEWQNRWDVIALLGLFAGGVFALRAIGDQLLPTYAEVNSLVYDLARWGLGLATGYITMAILLTSLHVSPLPREFMGFSPEGNNFLGITAPDRQWLAFTQYVSEKSLRVTQADGTPAIFDGVRYPAIPTDGSTSRVWSSFPIRYAARRQQYTTGTGGASTSPAAPSSGPPQVPNPQSSRGVGGGKAAPSTRATGF